MAAKPLFVRLGSTATPVGELIVDVDGQRATSTFRYDQSWLEHPRRFAIAPDMPLGAAPYYFREADGSALPPPVSDGTPDSWGRAIIKASLGGRACSDLDYLTESDDFLRSGALRYYESRAEDAPAVAAPAGKPGRVAVPRLMDLERVILEARAFEEDPAHYREKRAGMVGGDLLKDAIGSLGGARPKVNAIDDQGVLWIVKLAKADDRFSAAHAEVLAMNLAAEVGIKTSEAKVLSNGRSFPLAIIRRFDRAGATRVPFISAQTFMGLPGAAPGNYADVAFRMIRWSKAPIADQLELYRRLAYNVLVQNTDDHLRNLGFLSAGEDKWMLSPAFDVNPVPERGVTLKTAISEIHGTALDLEALLDASEYFAIKKDAAMKLLSTMGRTIKAGWKPLAGRIGMSGKDQRFITPAFENPQIEAAIKLGT